MISRWQTTRRYRPHSDDAARRVRIASHRDESHHRSPTRQTSACTPPLPPPPRRPGRHHHRPTMMRWQRPPPVPVRTHSRVLPKQSRASSERATAPLPPPPPWPDHHRRPTTTTWRPQSALRRRPTTMGPHPHLHLRVAQSAKFSKLPKMVQRSSDQSSKSIANGNTRC